MLKSMTGFGRSEIITESCKISVEMKAVNHRYLDLGIKMPKKFNYFEAGIRSLLKQYIRRGKVDLYITCEDYTEGNLSLRYNPSLAAEYMDYFQKMADQFHIQNDVSVSELSRCPEVLSMEQQPEDEEQMWKILERALEQAAASLLETRRKEGEHLKSDLFGKLDYMSVLVDEIEARSPGLITEYRQRLKEKVSELLSGAGIDDNRIAAEVTIYADKICTDEETVRLKSHIEATRRELLSDESVGRKLDFIAQEMNREANTILSKAGDLAISDRAITLKSEIEKVREQIQNIE